MSTLPAFRDAVTDFDVVDLAVDVEPAAWHAARDALAASGMVLLGEVHGVAQNPLLIRWLIHSLELRWLALEWPTEVADIARSFVEDGVLNDHEGLGAGDGRVTAGHLAVLRRLAAEREFDFFGFDTEPCTSPGPGESEWSARDLAVAETVLVRTRPGGCLVVGGNAHTGGSTTSYGTPMGAWLARARPGLRAITSATAKAGSTTSQAAASRLGATTRSTQFHLAGEALLVDLPDPTEADSSSARVNARLARKAMLGPRVGAGTEVDRSRSG